MVDQKISQLTELVAIDDTADLLAIVDDTATETKKITIARFDSRYLVAANDLSDVANAATARTNLGLVAGGAGDIWVEKAGDTMVGDLTFSGAFHPLIDPGADVDAVLLETNVTGAPQINWDESEDAFHFTHSLTITDSIINFGSPRTDNSIKSGRITVPQYDIDEEGILIFGYSSNAGANTVDFGGGSGSFNCATLINFVTASNKTTVTGTDRLRIWFNGGITIGDTHASSPGAENVVILGQLGVGGTSLNGQLHVDQASTTAAIPALLLDQADVSEEMIEFATTIGVGNAIEAEGGKALTTTHFIKVTIPGGLTRYFPVGTIA